jgi:hypothetical protein
VHLKVRANPKARERANPSQRIPRARGNPKKAKVRYTLQRLNHNGAMTMTMIKMTMATGIRSNVIDNFLHTYNGKVSNNGTAIKLQVTPGLDGKIATLATNNINLYFSQWLKSILKLQFILLEVVILMQPVILRHRIPNQVLVLPQRAILHPV